MSVFDEKKLGCDLKRTREGFSPVLTPETIPQFTIPPLATLESKRMFGNMKATAWKSNLWHSLDEEALEGKNFEELSDTNTSAAMSLPHLAKITTPYGFVTLAESPHVPNKEAVFFQVRTSIKEIPMVRSPSLHNTLTSNTKSTGCGSTSADTSTQPSDRRSSLKSFLPFRKPVYFRQSSMPVLNISSNVKVPEEDRKRTVFSDRSHSFPKLFRRNSSINLMQSIFKTHFCAKNESKSACFEDTES